VVDGESAAFARHLPVDALSAFCYLPLAKVL